MKRYFVIIITAFLCGLVSAQDLYVYSTIGTAEVKKGGSWQKLKRRDAVSMTDMIRVADNSALSLLDRKAEKVYALSKTAEKSAQSAIDAVKDKQPSMSAQFFNHAMKSMFNGEADKISHSAAGCTYRGDVVENDIAKSLASKCNGAGLKTITNEKTDMAVSFEIIDRETGTVINNQTQVGTQSYFRLHNNSNTALYVNVLDLDAQGGSYSCLPMDDAQTMSHLLIPAEATVDLSEYAIEFTEPVGSDCFVLIAVSQPYDLRMVEKYLKSNPAPATNAMPLGVYKREMIVKNPSK